ncbi:uncharacterized protein LOC101850756 [Aplysia californica]|uniref:Uncharacterized protein LOC101850756 n=1 Tax=Aplysia californica TaxID=6500 RepID=A0ABM0K624_APLCA|nr:uncharacterized protein LOC101850756 [Aplysia californica]
MGVSRPGRRLIIVSVGLALIYLATILIIIGLSTNNWKEIWDGNVYNDRIEVHFGLHRVCFSDGERCTNPGSHYDQSDYLPKVQALVIVGGFLSMFSAIFSLLNLTTDRLGWSHVGIMAPASVCAVLAGLFTTIGIILYSIKVEINNEYISFYRDIRLGWSFGLTTVAVCFLYIGGILEGVSTMISPQPQFE